MVLWFGSLAAAGLAAVVAQPEVLQALSPTYAVSFVLARPGTAFASPWAPWCS